MSKPKFVPFDAGGYPRIKWIPMFIKEAFDKPKELPMWDASKDDQRERLLSLADGVKQFLGQLPDGAEIGTGELAKCLCPDFWDHLHMRKFLIGRIERMRYFNMLDTHFYSVPDTRWKNPKSFYKYHNGKGRVNEH